MPIVKFTYALKRFFPALKDLELAEQSIPELLEGIDKQYPGIKHYILTEQGSLRQHVNIFLDGSLIKDRKHLSDLIKPQSEIYIMQALSGG